MSDPRVRRDFPFNSAEASQSGFVPSILNNETEKSGTYNEFLRLAKTNWEKKNPIVLLANIPASTSFGHIFAIFQNGEYLAYQITNIDAAQSTA